MPETAMMYGRKPFGRNVTVFKKKLSLKIMLASGTTGRSSRIAMQMMVLA